jgi:hypothetical protein
MQSDDGLNVKARRRGSPHRSYFKTTFSVTLSEAKGLKYLKR